MSALAKSFAQHAEKLERKGSTWVRRYNYVTGKYNWVVSYRAPEVNAAIQNCNNQAYYFSNR